MMRKLFLASVVLCALLLGGCAAMHQLNNDVSTYSQWPAERPPASYVFERLPSQQAHAEQQQMLEDAARDAVEKAGFTPAADAASATFTIELGARATPNERSPFDDPFWWHGGFHAGYGYGHGRFGHPYWPGWWGPRYDPATYEREVALMIRDRQSGQVLYEARASNDGLTPFFDGIFPAMFEAALKDFPTGGANPRRVTVELSKVP